MNHCKEVEKLVDILKGKIDAVKIERHNEYTMAWSDGYLKGMRELLSIAEKHMEECKKEEPNNEG